MISKQLFATAALAGGMLLQAESGYKISGRFAMKGTESWDYVTIDNEARRVYVSHGTRVEVLNADTGMQVGTIADTPGVHGIAIATGMNRGFTTNGQESKVSIFDTRTLKLIEKIEVGKGPDGIYYHAASKRVFTCNHGSDDITAIDAKSGKVAGTVAVKGAGDQMVTGKNGLIYVNMEDTSEVVAFDPMTLAVKHRFRIGVGSTPTGLAYDAKYDRLFIGCRRKSMVVMDAANGKVISSLPIGTGVDWAEFDSDSKLVFLSTGDGMLSIFRQLSADKYEDAGAVTTQNSAKTFAFDPRTKRILLPAADVELVSQGEGKKPLRRIKPGSFALIVLSK